MSEYIPDEEIDLDKKDILKTLPYVETLDEFIKKADGPLTIGLFGGWGSGKSSIVKTLKNRLENDDEKKIRVFTYDAWKYSKDPFRRSFIIELKKEFGLKKDSELLYSDKQVDTEIKTSLNKRGVIVATISLVLFSIILVYFLLPATPSGLQISFVLGATLLFSLVQFFITNAFSGYKTVVNYPKLFSPEQFEGYFDDVLGEILLEEEEGEDKKTSIINRIVASVKKHGKKKTDENKYQKLVIVIDNIDRCEEKTAPELLLTIKNFLEKKGVIFLIPIDDEAIKKYLGGGDYATEFLRKIFNITISIKEFLEDDLYDFAKKQSENYKLELPNEVISLIAQEFSRSPRKMIQFMNVMKLEIELAKKQEERGNIPEGAITQNLSMLTKILIIREEFPELYYYLEKKPHYLKEINTNLSINNDPFIPNPQLEEDTSIEKFNKSITPEQKNFLVRTQSIDASNLEVFFVTKKLDWNLPNNIGSLMDSNEWETIKDGLKRKEYEMDELIRYISSTLTKEVFEKGLWNFRVISLFSMIFRIASDKEFSSEFWRSFNREGSTIQGLMQKVEMRDSISHFHAEHVLNFAGTLKERGYKDLSEKIAASIDATSLKENPKLARGFLVRFGDDEHLLQKVGRTFSFALEDDLSIYHEFEDLFKAEKFTRYFIRENTVKEFVDKIDQSPNKNNTREMVEIIRLYVIDCKSCELGKEIINKYIEKILQFIEKSITKNDFDDLWFWLSALQGFIEKTGESQIRNLIYNKLSPVYQLLLSFSKQNMKKSQEKVVIHFLAVAKELYMVDLQDKSEILKSFEPLFQKNESKIYMKINQLYYDIVKSDTSKSWPFANMVLNKLFHKVESWDEKRKLAETINLMLIKSDEEGGLSLSEIEHVLRNYIPLARDLEKDEKQGEVIEWLSEISKNSMVKDELNKILPELLESYYPVFIKLVENTPSLFAGKVISLLNSENKTENLFALKILQNLENSDDRKEDITKSLIHLNTEEYSKEERKLFEEVKEKWGP